MLKDRFHPDSTYGKALNNINYTKVVVAYNNDKVSLSYDAKILYIAETLGMDHFEVKSLLDVHRGLI